MEHMARGTRRFVFNHPLINLLSISIVQAWEGKQTGDQTWTMGNLALKVSRCRRL